MTDDLPTPRVLRTTGDRVHRWQASVLDALRECSAPVSAQTLHAMLRRDDRRVGLSTVYRELHRLVESGQLREDYVGTESVYRLSDRDLLICDECGRAQELPRPVRSAAVFEGFFGRSWPVTVHGRCTSCAPVAAQTPRSRA